MSGEKYRKLRGKDKRIHPDHGQDNNTFELEPVDEEKQNNKYNIYILYIMICGSYLGQNYNFSHLYPMFQICHHQGNIGSLIFS